MKREWETHNSAHVQTLHTDVSLHSVYDTIPGKLDFKYCPNPDQRRMMRRILLIDGVVSVSSGDGYALRIRKGHVFAWPRIQQRVVVEMERFAATCETELNTEPERTPRGVHVREKPHE